MKTRTLPGTDLHLSVVGMGCWTIAGEHWGPTDDDESIATIRAAVESGIDWFDTAPLYGRGRADTLLRRALGSHIHRVTIATKVGVRWEGEAPEGRE
ncbi:MAG: aldo/keto reductase, partial [Deltaproteobacteria bacterium]